MKPWYRRFCVCLAAAALVAVGCDSVSLKDDARLVEFALSGSINSEFADVAPGFRGQAVFSRSGIANRLDVSLEVTGRDGDRRERARVSFRFAYASNTGELPPGHYSVVPDDVVSSIGDGFYESVSGTAEHARYVFSGRSLKLDVEESEPGRISARFSLELEQTEGERYVDGQQTVAELIGAVMARGAFDLVIEGLELPTGA